jgi:hypothetical protein
MSTATYIAVNIRGIAEDQRVRRNIMRHYRSRAYQGKSPYGDATAYNRAAAYRSTITDYRGSDLPVISGFELPLQGNGSGKQVISETHMRADEDAILQGNALKDRGVILYLYSRTDLDMSIDVDAFSDVALLTDMNMLTHLSLAPYTGSRSHLRRGRHLRCRVDIRER